LPAQNVGNWLIDRLAHIPAGNNWCIMRCA
jgi:hypothetical protein